MAPTSLHSLVPELILSIMHFIPDIDSLKNAMLSNSAIYRIVDSHKSSIFTSVLRNEIPASVYTHAVVAQLAQDTGCTFPSFERIDFDQIMGHVNQLQHYRCISQDVLLSRFAVMSISRTYRKVEELAHLLIDDCPYARQQHFFPLWDSLRYRPPVESELVRVRQAIYLYQILACLCGNLRFMDPSNRDYLLACHDSIGDVQECLMQRLMAPWEMYEVIAVQCYFRRALHGFGKSPLAHMYRLLY